MFIPEFLIDLGKESAKHQGWIDSLPDILKKLSEQWDLSLGEVYVDNVSCSYVVNCMVAEKEQAVLKIGFPHFEALYEIDGLKLLNGNPTVKLLNFDSVTNSMLLEKCIPGTNLNTLDLPSQDVIICTLLNEIWKVNYTNEHFHPLSKMVSLWNEETYQALNSFPDAYLAEQGCKLKEHLISTTEDNVLLATDLHAGNVLKAQRNPWLVIDIKPHIGDRSYDLTQHLLNSMERIHKNPLETINKLADQAEVSRSRLKDWLFARLASEFKGTYQDIALGLQ